MDDVLNNGLPRRMQCGRTKLRRKEDGKIFTVTELGCWHGDHRNRKKRVSGHEFKSDDGETVTMFMESVTDERREVARLFEDVSLAEFDPKLWAGTGI